jgi:hypothetical protein
MPNLKKVGENENITVRVSNIYNSLRKFGGKFGADPNPNYVRPAVTECWPDSPAVYRAAAKGHRHLGCGNCWKGEPGLSRDLCSRQLCTACSLQVQLQRPRARYNPKTTKSLEQSNTERTIARTAKS